MQNNKILQNRNLKKLLQSIDSTNYNATEKALYFYKLVIDLERSKEPDIIEYYDYPINYKNDSLMLVDLPCNHKFNAVFTDNLKVKFNKDLNISIIVVVEGKDYRLLNMVIPFDEIKAIDIDKELLPIRIEDFEVNLKEANKLELTTEHIETINIGIKENPTMQGILTLMRKELGGNVEICNNIYLALSTKSIELSQIYSELNNIRLRNAVNSNSLLNDFLNYNGIDNIVDNIEEEELLQITELDEFQKKAVALALNSKVSVITGPPGTGKTQVIENILANSLIKGKKVLVASKNNKAVDNVKDRFDNIDKTGYLIRFGSKKLINEKTKPDIQRILSEISMISDNIDEYNDISQKYNNAVDRIRKAKESLASKELLSKYIQNINNSLKDKEDKLSILIEKHKSTISNIENRFAEVSDIKGMSDKDLDDCKAKLKQQHNITESKFTGAFSFWYNCFFKKKYAMLLLNLIEEIPIKLKYKIKEMKLKTNVKDFRSYDDIDEYYKSVIGLVDKVIEFYKEFEEEKEKYQLGKESIEDDIERIKSDLKDKQIELDKLISIESDLKLDISNSNFWIRNNSMTLLHNYIKHYKHKHQASKKIISYISYIPEHIPFKDNEYPYYINSANEFLNVFKLCAVTSLSSKNAFPLSEELFDIVVIDEASQCDIASALPLIMRAKQLVVIGDPMQLKHITSVRTEEEIEIKKVLGLEDKTYIKYANSSLWDYCQGFISRSTTGITKPFMLQCHYRCHPDIIEYSNNIFYSGRIGAPLKVKTDTSKFMWKEQGVFIHDVKGIQVNDNININEEEALVATQIATDIASKNDKVSIGIVTPFKHQAEKINLMIPSIYNNRIEVNTVHKYQGDEKDIIIYSLVVTENSPSRKINWIDNSVPNLVNVAVTRAKSTLYIVCNVDYIKSNSKPTDPLGYLISYKA